MAKITFKNTSAIDTAIRQAVDKRMTNIFARGGPLLIKQQAEILRNAFRDSPEFASIKTDMVGEFGFTNQEVANLDRILELLVPGNGPITISDIKASKGRPKSLMLKWIDFGKLKDHEFAQHALTRLDNTGSITEVTDIVSWIEWLEEGVSVLGYTFSDAIGQKGRSRSGEGIMQQQKGGSFTIQPSRVFERIADLGSRPGGLNIIKKGFGIIAKRLGK